MRDAGITVSGDGSDIPYSYDEDLPVIAAYKYINNDIEVSVICLSTITANQADEYIFTLHTRLANDTTMNAISAYITKEDASSYTMNVQNTPYDLVAGKTCPVYEYPKSNPPTAISSGSYIIDPSVNSPKEITVVQNYSYTDGTNTVDVYIKVTPDKYYKLYNRSGNMFRATSPATYDAILTTGGSFTATSSSTGNVSWIKELTYTPTQEAAIGVSSPTITGNHAVWTLPEGLYESLERVYNYRHSSEYFDTDESYMNQAKTDWLTLMGDIERTQLVNEYYTAQEYWNSYVNDFLGLDLVSEMDAYITTYWYPGSNVSVSPIRDFANKTITWRVTDSQGNLIRNVAFKLEASPKIISNV